MKDDDGLWLATCPQDALQIRLRKPSRSRDDSVLSATANGIGDSKHLPYKASSLSSPLFEPPRHGIEAPPRAFTSYSMAVILTYMQQTRAFHSLYAPSVQQLGPGRGPALQVEVVTFVTCPHVIPVLEQQYVQDSNSGPTYDEDC